MASTRKKENETYVSLKKALAEGNISNWYLFYGEETYLRDYYVGQIKKLVLQGGLEEFNFEYFDGKEVTLEKLSEAVEGYPVMSERKLILIRDFDIAKPPAALREGLENLFRDLPEYVCVVFLYDTIEYKPDKRLKLGMLITERCSVVNFARLEPCDVIPYIKRRFSALNKIIDTKECEYLIFLCGPLLSALNNEIAKIAAYEIRQNISRKSIDAVASKTLDAVIYQMTDELSKGEFDKAIMIFRELSQLKYDMSLILAAISRHFQRLYSAKLAMAKGKGTQYIMSLWQQRSSYAAEQILNTARKTDLAFLKAAILEAGNCDVALKTAGGDRERILELYIMRLSSIFGGNK